MRLKNGDGPCPLEMSSTQPVPRPMFRPLGRDVLHGRCRRGWSEIPHFCSKLQLFARVLQENKRKRRKTKKSEEKRRKTKKCVEKGENSSNPIYTNPIKNLPIGGQLDFRKRASDPRPSHTRQTYMNHSNSVLTLYGLILAPILNLFKLPFWVLGS